MVYISVILHYILQIMEITKSLYNRVLTQISAVLTIAFPPIHPPTHPLFLTATVQFLGTVSLMYEFTNRSQETCRKQVLLLINSLFYPFYCLPMFLGHQQQRYYHEFWQ